MYGTTIHLESIITGLDRNHLGQWAHYMILYKRLIALALDVNKQQPTARHFVWHFRITTAKYKCEKGIDLLLLQTTINIQFNWWVLLRKMSSIIQMIYSQHFWNEIILSWSSLIQQFSFSRKKQSTSNQQGLVKIYWCVVTLQWLSAGIPSTMQWSVYAGANFVVSNKLHNTFGITSESTTLLLEMDFQKRVM